MTAGASVHQPGAGPLPSLELGDVVDERLPSAARVVVVRKAQVPLVQLRLRFPLGDVRMRDGVALRLLPKMLLAGTGSRSASEMAAAIQEIGASVVTWASVDHLAIDASGPSSRLPSLLQLLADLVASPSFPRAEVAGERERVAQEVLREAADPDAAATRALTAELFPSHPYADPLPDVAAVRRAGRSAIDRFHDAHVRAAPMTLVVVGDVDPDVAVERAGVLEVARSQGDAPDRDALLEPRLPRDRGGIRIVHRPGAVQSNLRVGARCEGRHDPAFPALQLAMTVLGGSFVSRIVTNLRERNGYTYAPRAELDEHRLATAVTVQADVATEVTARALTELRYELARIATAEVTDEELESSRRYLVGTTVMRSATQAGLADTLASLVAHDLEPSYLESFVSALAGLDVESALGAAARALGPVGMTTVVVGDATEIADSLAPLDDVTVIGHDD